MNEVAKAPVFDPAAPPVPMAMLAELTHRCPLKCPYCSNPMELIKRSGELSTQQWVDVFAQAGALGVLHVHLSGGEPAARTDLPELVTGARAADLYTNLITSGVTLREHVFHDCVERGLDHVQLSIQGADAKTADHVGGFRGGFETKMKVADWVAAAGLPLTVNAVMHRQNLDQLPEMIDLAERLGAHRLEVANTQYHGWAFANRAALMPTDEQVWRSKDQVEAARERLKGKMVIDYVMPDHFATYPKACLGGWGRVGLSIMPDGQVLPCHAAVTIPNLTFDNVKERPLAEIWREGQAFKAYRGDDWMPELCRTCDRKHIDWGGCRCQAMAYLGDAAETDPACHRSPHHALVRDHASKTLEGQDDTFTYRG